MESAKAIFWIFFGALSTSVFAQSGPQEIPIERCDRLPVVAVKADGKQMRFLVDTAATSTLNLKSFPGGKIQQIEVTSWQGSNSAASREIQVPEIALGAYRIRDLKLPAVDLTPIGAACGKRIDGILGVDLLEKMGATIDLHRRIAYLPGEQPQPIRPGVLDEIRVSHDECIVAFNSGDKKKFGECLDENMVWFTPWGEVHSRQGILDYFQEHFFSTSPPAQVNFDSHNFHLLGGDAYWCNYEYTVKLPKGSYTARGMAMARRNGNQWQMVSAHNSSAAGMTEPK